MSKSDSSSKQTKSLPPEVAATIRGAMSAIYKGQQKYSNHNGQTNQGPKHISFCLSALLELMKSRLGDEHE
jgi:hypothetical protein